MVSEERRLHLARLWFDQGIDVETPADPRNCVYARYLRRITTEQTMAGLLALTYTPTVMAPTRTTGQSQARSPS